MKIAPNLRALVLGDNDTIASAYPDAGRELRALLGVVEAARSASPWICVHSLTVDDARGCGRCLGCRMDRALRRLTRKPRVPARRGKR